MSRRRSYVLIPVAAASLVGAVAATARAQGSCDVSENNPGEVAKAFLAVNAARQAQGTGAADAAAKQLTAAVQSLTKPTRKDENPIGRQLVLGKALSLWANQPGIPQVTTRGALGFTDAPTASIDLYAAIDSVFGAVEKAQPGCERTIAGWRGQKAWLGLVNGAVEALNAQQLDSADAIAARSLVLYRGAPYGHMVRGNVAYAKGNPAAAVQFYRAGVAAAAADTSYDEQYRQLSLTLGNIAAEVADSAHGDAKATWNREAIAAYEGLVTKFPNSNEARSAAERLPKVKLAAGDTAGVKAAYAKFLADPSKFGYTELLNAGVAAGRADQAKDAATLFEAALAQNPYSRDALYNAALMHNQLNEFPQILPLATRLVAIDPGNGDNWMLFAFAYNGMAKASKVPKQTSAYRDSLGKYYQKAEQLPYQVKFTSWTQGEGKGTLKGTIENKGTTARSYPLTIEFLDKSGAVVDTKSVTTGDVAPKAKGQFTAETSNANAVAYRYKALP